jgi:dolichol kinase
MAGGHCEKENKTWERSGAFFACIVFIISILFGVSALMMLKHSGHPWEQ